MDSISQKNKMLLRSRGHREVSVDAVQKVVRRVDEVRDRQACARNRDTVKQNFHDRPLYFIAI